MKEFHPYHHDCYQTPIDNAHKRSGQIIFATSSSSLTTMAPKKSATPATIPASSATTSATQPRTVTSKTFENKSASSSTSTSAAPSTLRAQDFQSIITHVWSNYNNHTPQRVKLIDTFLGFLLVVGVLQFAYCVLAGNFVSPGSPYNERAGIILQWANWLQRMAMGR